MNSKYSQLDIRTEMFLNFVPSESYLCKHFQEIHLLCVPAVQIYLKFASFYKFIVKLLKDVRTNVDS